MSRAFINQTVFILHAVFFQHKSRNYIGHPGKCFVNPDLIPNISDNITEISLTLFF